MKKAVRKAVLQRDQQTCVCCQEWLLRSRLQIHHILPIRHFGPDTLFNLVTICYECHADWHRTESQLEVLWDPTLCVLEFYRWLLGPEEGVEAALDHRQATLDHYENLLERLIRQIPRTRQQSCRNLRQTRAPRPPR